MASLASSESDLIGHEGGGEHSKRPHWHFQMYVDGRPFVRYNDFHLPLSVADVGFLEFMRANPGKVHGRLAAGMYELLDESTLEHVVAMSLSGATDDEAEGAPIKLDTFIRAEPGKTIRGDDIHNLIQQALDEGVTVTRKMRELKDVSVLTIVSPGTRRCTRNGAGNSAVFCLARSSMRRSSRPAGRRPIPIKIPLFGLLQ